MKQQIKFLAKNEFTVLLRFFVSKGYQQEAVYRMLSEELYSAKQSELLAEMEIDPDYLSILIDFLGLFRTGSQEIVIHRRSSAS